MFYLTGKKGRERGAGCASDIYIYIYSQGILENGSEGKRRDPSLSNCPFHTLPQ